MMESGQRERPAKAAMAPEIQTSSRIKKSRTNRKAFFEAQAPARSRRSSSGNRSKGRSSHREQTLLSIIICLIVLLLIAGREFPAVKCKSLWPVGEQASSSPPLSSLSSGGSLGEDGAATGSSLWRPMMDYAMGSANKSLPQSPLQLTSPLANHVNRHRQQLLLANNEQRSASESSAPTATASRQASGAVVAAGSAMSEVRAPNLRARQPMRPQHQHQQQQQQQQQLEQEKQKRRRRQQQQDDDMDADMGGPLFDDDDDSDEPEAQVRAPQLAGAARAPGGRGNQARANESVLLGSSIAAPSSLRQHRHPNHEFRAIEARRRQQQQQQQMQFQTGNGGANGGQQSPPANDEMAEDERRATETSDEAASEAEAADRSALDEQRQQQREIILAQAQSEAKAIKEQQEALLRQQQALRQILLSRHREISVPETASGGGGKQRTSASSRRDDHSRRAQNSRMHPGRSGSSVDQPASQRARAEAAARGREHERLLQLQSATSAQSDEADSPPSSGQNGDFGRPLDSQFSDQPDSNNRRDDELPTEPAYSGADRRQGHRHHRQQDQQAGEADEVAASDLVVAAQHHYGGMHQYGGGGGGGGHKGDYYQFAESHKKGQFDSGFKRGGKKFQISGHSSQNKGHAEGHVKWHGKKGKGSQYWDLQHKDKKPHYGHSYDHSSYGGQHYY